ncbi:MAG: addiction module protein [Thermoguttaceae bacterium]
MEPAARQLFDSALNLPDSERAELAARLIESLDKRVDDDLDVAWGEEITRRFEELDTGKVAGVSWVEARRMIMGGHHGPSAD